MNRSIYCYTCKKVKENPKSGYCLACNREQWKKRSKPDCATCGNKKENIKDSYCNECKRKKAAIKSADEGRRYQVPKGFGRTIFCSKCGDIKRGSYAKESYCGPCKIARRKELRPTRNDEQVFKDNVRKMTWKKIREGELVRQPCEVCGIDKTIEAHHDDYYRPLEVRWLCRKHHIEHHINERNKD